MRIKHFLIRIKNIFLIKKYLVFIPRGVYPGDWPAVAVTLVGKMCITFSWAVLFLYTAELLPTEVRTSGIGSSSFIGRFGGMIAPWIELLGKHHHPYLPPIGSTIIPHTPVVLSQSMQTI